MPMQYDENMGGWYDDGQSNNFAVAPEPAPDQSLAVQPAPTVNSDMVVDRGMGPNVGDPYNGMGPPDLAVTPAIGGQDFAVNPQSAAPDYAAYTNSYPDLAAAAQAQGMDPATFGAMHYASSGQAEGRALPGSSPSLAVNPPTDTSSFAVFGDTGIKYGVDPSGQAFFNNQPISAEDYAVLTKNAAANPSLAVKEGEGQDTGPVNFAPGVSYNPQGHTDPSTPIISTTGASKNAFDYSTTLAGEPQVQNGPLKLNGGRTFNAQGPYYAPRTNDGDAAGAVYAAPDQKVRMIDPKTGSVVFEGVGPEGAKQATALANSLSMSDGKKAAWAIQKDDPNQGWQTMAADAVDTVHPNLLVTLASVALPLILGAVFPPLAVLGSTLIGATGTLATMANVAALNMISSTLMNAAQGQSFGDALKNGLTQGAVAGLTAGIIRALPPSVQNVFNAPGNLATKGVNAIRDAVPGIDSALRTINTGLSTGINAVGSVTAPLVHGVANVANVVANPIGALTHALSGPATPAAPGTLSGVTITGAPSAPVTVPLVGNPGGIRDLSGVDVTGQRPTPATPPPPPAPPPPATPPPPPPPPVTIIDPKVPGIPLSPDPGGTGGTGGTSLTLDQLRAQLSPTFRAKLPKSRMQLGQRQVTLTPEQWRQYAIHPRGVPQRGGEEAFFNYAVDPLMTPVAAAEGGHIRNFAVNGPGTGRSDSIAAKLSDGEYVIDAETVALLGDGSSKAGAQRLDQMRVNVRKHKGQNLAKGRFSVNAKAPETYLSGGRT
jgi:hypothetical protein